MEAIFLSSDIKSLCRFAILGLIFALNGCVYACIPIIFYRPAFLCGQQTDEADGELTYSLCSEQEACSSQFPYKTLSEYSQINSVSMEFELYCGQKIVEATILTVMAAGQIFAFIIGTAIYIHPKKQYDYFIQGNLITGISLVLSYFVTSPYLLFPILFVWNLYYGLYMSVIFAHLNFFFSGALSKFGPAIFNTGWPAFMLLYCLFTYYYGDWKESLVFFAGIPYLILTFLLIYFKAPAIANRHTNTSISHGMAAGHQQHGNVNAAIKKAEKFSSELEMISTDSTPAFLPLNSSNKITTAKPEQIAPKRIPENIELSKSRILTGQKKTKKLGLSKRLLNVEKQEISINASPAQELSNLKLTAISNGIDLENRENNNTTKLIQESTTMNTSTSKNLEGTKTPSLHGASHGPPSSSAWEDFKKQLLSIKSNPKYFKNVILFVLCWLGTNIAYFGCLLVMSDLGGNIYTNVAMSTVFEFAGNLSAAFLIMKFPQHQILKIAFLIVGIAYLSCLIYDPTKQDVAAGYSFQVILSLIPIVIAKGTHEMLWTVLQTYLNTILPVEFHQFSFACSNLVSVFVMDLLPFYKFLMEQLELNQFVGYSLYCLFTFKIIDYFEDLYRDDGKPICPANHSETEMHIIETDYFAQQETDRQKQLRKEILAKAQHQGFTTI